MNRIARLLLAMLAGVAPYASAQDGAGDLTRLSLEELMEMEVIPVDVLGTHIHLQGDWMVGYGYMLMDMADHAGHVSHADFRVLPMGMRMEMHMVHVMYGATDRITLEAMIPYHRMSMEGHGSPGGAFTTSSEGAGDIEAGAHYALFVREADYLLGKLAVSLPTGSVDVRADTPLAPDLKQPYPMQLGTGSFGLVTGLTYIDQFHSWAWGTYAEARVALGHNRFDYRVGNRYDGGIWATRRVTDWFAPVVRLDLHRQEPFSGADPDIDPAYAPSADPRLQSETRIDLKPGLSFYVPAGALRGQRLMLTAPVPLFARRADGHPHGGRQVSLMWQWTF